MPRRTAPLSPNQYYHLYNRGNNRGRIFFEEENYLFFLRKMRQYLCSVVDIVGYCLMPTHYHLIVRVKELEAKKGGIETSEVLETSEVFSEAMRRFSISYTKAINKRFDRVGSLFQGAYKAKHIEDESYLVGVSRYVHLNPVAAGLVERPAEWRFSSYQDVIGERTGTLPRPGAILASFDSREAYRRFVEAPPRGDRQEADWQDALFEQ